MKVTKKQNTLGFALLLASFSALGPFTVDMYLSSLPEIMNYFQTNTSMIQATLTASLLGLGIGQFVMGPLSDIYGRRYPLLISMILYFMFSIACAFAPTIELFIGIRFVQGFVASAGLVISRAIVRDLYHGSELTTFISVLTMISNVAPLISPLAGSGVIAYTSWNHIFTGLGLLGIVLTLLTIWGIPETLPADKRIAGHFGKVIGNYKELFRDRIFMSYALGNGILFAGVFAYVSATPFIYQNMYGISPIVFSILFALNGVAIMLGSQLVKYLAGHIHERRIFVIGLLSAFVASIVILLMTLSSGSLIGLVIALFLFAFSIGLIGPVSFSLAMESQGHIAGSASAVLGVLPFFLGSLTSPLVGLAGEYSAKPFGIVIFTVSLLSLISYKVLNTASTSKMLNNH